MKHLWALVALLAAAGCDSGLGASNSGEPDLGIADLVGAATDDLTPAAMPADDLAQAIAPDAARAPDGAAGSPYLFPAVWVILMENHDRPTILASASATHIRALASTYAQAAKYSSTLAPSLPNYIEMTCGCNANHAAFTATDGSAQSLLTAGKPLFPETSLGGQLEAAQVPWRAYAQDSAANSQLTPCYAGNTGRYVSRHVPFVYYQDLYGMSSPPSAACINRVRVFGDQTTKIGDFYTDLAGGTYAYQWITPDVIYDMHDGTIAQGDGFVDKVVTEIQNTAQYKAGGVIFLTWDEGETSSAILFVAISNRAKMGYQSMTKYTHDNFLATVEDIFKLPRTGAAVGAANMLELFN